MSKTDLQKQSSDNPASVHTRREPEETNLPAVNTSETSKNGGSTDEERAQQN